MGNKFSERLRAERQRAGLSQDDIAEVCKNRDGEMPSRAAIAQWEKPNGTRPTFDNLVATAKRLNVSLDYLVGLSNRREINGNLIAAEGSPRYNDASENAVRVAKKWQTLPAPTRDAIETLINSMITQYGRARKGG